MENSVENFLTSKFYQKHINEYFVDKIIKNVYGKEIKIHKLYGINSYSDIHRCNTEILKDLNDLFIKPKNITDNNFIWKLIHSVYIDPDPYSTKDHNGIICTADGLISIKRIFTLYGLSNESISEYDRYRNTPIFYFPKERNGVNMTRATTFGDKIDYTLFDIKNYYSNSAEICKMYNAFNLPKTKRWLDDIASFENFVSMYGIYGIFVNENLDIYDLESNDKSIITDYNEIYKWKWSSNYYNNLKRKIDEYYYANKIIITSK